MIPLSYYLVFAAALFLIGLFGVLTRKHAIGMLMSLELMLNAVNVNLIAFWHYWLQQSGTPPVAPYVFVAIVLVVAAAEVAVGLALVISAYRLRRTSVVDELTTLKG
ncbi:MAG TPA: NADH-quinone oxidoreductase subunit NuoK [Bellilinea sp.]|nr:NADH-quinone oxidoreductase subunit NuoK [Bellilinea sp.]